MKLKNIFLRGVMNKDLDERLVPQNEYIHAENLRMTKSEGSDSGAGENLLGNKQVASKDYGPNAECIGGLADESEEILIYCVVSDTGSYVMEWNENTQTLTTILEDTRAPGSNVLNFNRDYLITGINLFIDLEKNNRLLIFNDDLNPPRCINTERAKKYGPNNFREEQILLIKKPPINSPTITTEEADPDAENNLREKFISFSYRWKYLDGEYSALSPFSKVAFQPEDFFFDYATGSNEGMVNTIGNVIVQFSTGSDLVTDIEVVFKESGSNTIYFVESFNKEDKGWTDNAFQSTNFSNNKVTKILPERELYRLYDNVPLKCKSQTMIGNRLLFGNYLENFNMTDRYGNPIHVDLQLSKISKVIEKGKAYKTLKSIRDYEAGVVYVDDYGRSTTPLTGGDNTIHIPVKDSVKQNTLSLRINSEPPSFAKYYRVFLKQNKEHYDTVVGSRFYPDGVFVWMKMGPTDVDKFKEGDYLIVKSDTSGPVDRYVETRVVEIKDQPKNFLEKETEEAETDAEGVVRQPQGFYYKLKPEGYSLSQQDMETYLWEAFNSSYKPSIFYDTNYIEVPSYYGSRGLDDLSSLGTYTKSDADIRYIVDIDSTDNTLFNPITGLDEVFDTFRWSDDDGATWTRNVRITGNPQSLSNGVQVQFDNISGHSSTDNWIIPAKGGDTNNFGGDQGNKGHLIIKGPDGDKIYAGAQIDLLVREEKRGDPDREREYSFTSTQNYDNLEEWFYGDGIDEEIEGDFHTYWFRRGRAERGDGNRAYFYQNTQEEVRDFPDDYDAVLGGGLASSSGRGEMVMIIRSYYTSSNFLDAEAEMEGYFKVVQSDVQILFETKEDRVKSDIYYELSKTYPVVNGKHIGDNGVGLHNLEAFNAFTWGNGFESYKIKDSITGNPLLIDSRPLGAVEDYKQSRRKASLTYSNVYEQSTGYNALNEFNLSTANYKDLDTGYGSIQRLYSRDNNVLVLREDKVSQILFNKAVLYNADGSSNVQQTNQVLGDDIPYSGEFGIGKSPESFVAYATWISWVDPVRGKVIKLGGNGVFPISSQKMNSYFRDQFKGSPDIKALGAFDPYMDEVMYTLGDNPTVGYSISDEGWCSFYSFTPDWALRLGNKFFTLKEGQIYKHNDETVPRNTFYGSSYPSKLRFAANQSPSDIKVYKTFDIEGNQPWDVNIKTFQSGEETFKESTITNTEFAKKEGYWYAFIRRNELTSDNSPKSTYGIGVVANVSGFDIDVSVENEAVTAGDKIYTEDGTLIGKVTSTSGTVITLDTPLLNIVGQYVYGVKSARIEGSAMRGYTSIIEMENDSTDKLEIFATNTEVFKSHR